MCRHVSPKTDRYSLVVRPPVRTSRATVLRNVDRFAQCTRQALNPKNHPTHVALRARAPLPSQTCTTSPEAKDGKVEGAFGTSNIARERASRGRKSQESHRVSCTGSSATPVTSPHEPEQSFWRTSKDLTRILQESRMSAKASTSESHNPDHEKACLEHLAH